jgi:hypothetical protein
VSRFQHELMFVACITCGSASFRFCVAMGLNSSVAYGQVRTHYFVSLLFAGCTRLYAWVRRSSGVLRRRRRDNAESVGCVIYIFDLGTSH